MKQHVGWGYLVVLMFVFCFAYLCIFCYRLVSVADMQDCFCVCFRSYEGCILRKREFRLVSSKVYLLLVDFRCFFFFIHTFHPWLLQFVFQFFFCTVFMLVNCRVGLMLVKLGRNINWHFIFFSEPFIFKLSFCCIYSACASSLKLTCICIAKLYSKMSPSTYIENGRWIEYSKYAV